MHKADEAVPVADMTVLTRIYLGVHFLTDVLAAWALGAAWAVTIALVATVWEHARPGNARSA